MAVLLKKFLDSFSFFFGEEEANGADPFDEVFLLVVDEDFGGAEGVLFLFVPEEDGVSFVGDEAGFLGMGIVDEMVGEPFAQGAGEVVGEDPDVAIEAEGVGSDFRPLEGIFGFCFVCKEEEGFFFVFELAVWGIGAGEKKGLLVEGHRPVIGEPLIFF